MAEVTVSELPAVTVIMPIRNEAAFIERSLAAVLAQAYPEDRLQVLVVDGMSEDGTRDALRRLLEQHPNAWMLDNPQQIVPTAMNIGLDQAEGDIIVRVDGHTIISKDYVRRCLEALDYSRADCVGGPMQAVGDNAFAEAVALATSHPFGVGGSRFHYATEPMEVDTVYMGAWPRQVFEQVGRFDEEMVRNQDDELSYRLRAAGGRIWLDPAIRCTYHVRSSARSLWRQYFQYGYWKVRVFQKVSGSAQLRHWVPPTFAAAVLGGLLGAIVIPLLRPFYAAGLTLYVLGVLVASALVSARHGWRHLLRLPLAFISLHLAYGFGFWAGMVRFGLPGGKGGDHG